MVAALYLTLAIGLEIVATSALRQSDGFTRLWPTVLVATCYPVSFYLLSLALRTISLAVAYAIWSGAGTAVIAAIGVIAYQEHMNALKAACLALIVLGVVGLQFSGTHR
ncbi:multidrug efflux SMR transporter [Frankia sp. CNm7]|uniref:Multidrug efflux SMR transporter n=1 Tax=Frankia nepalensis TaxID=1836974 RepID=A0A937UR31_9ACTN|nr:multidrug efflux SMR transporter [Frankia nepalensis]MBL7500385.1 multidrug efflux SMR transporter [Frankia nepalensis]MBL7508683.1 multidrug efflux SMR transporter [Frankia nepalensis]MBL7518481.1 multidrug efflux SMR transporter [Frankia nepalensis]MBL7628845.1 multidrug efflux SMR transporter [Frankia nepalensis]